MGVVTVGHRRARRIVGAFAVALVAVSVATPTSAAPRQSSELYVPPPDRDARRQIAALRAHRDKESADLIRAMIDTPQAVWFTAGTPRAVQSDVRGTVVRAVARGTVPVLVAYNIPFRDCAQFSAGGATTPAEYRGVDRRLRRRHRRP